MKKTNQLFFDAESIDEISKPFLKFVTDGRTDRRTDGLISLRKQTYLTNNMDFITGPGSPGF